MSYKFDVKRCDWDSGVAVETFCLIGYLALPSAYPVSNTFLCY